MTALFNTTNSRPINLKTHSNHQPKHHKRQRRKKREKWRKTTRQNKRSHKVRMLQDPRSKRSIVATKNHTNQPKDITVPIPQMMILLTKTSHPRLKLPNSQIRLQRKREAR